MNQRKGQRNFANDSLIQVNSNEELAMSKTMTYHDKKMIVNKERMRIDKISRFARASRDAKRKVSQSST